MDVGEGVGVWVRLKAKSRSERAREHTKTGRMTGKLVGESFEWVELIWTAKVSALACLRAR